MDEVVITSDSWRSFGDVFVRMIASRGGVKLADQIISANDSAAITALTTELVAATDKDPSAVEQVLAEIITKARRPKEVSNLSAGYQPNWLSSADLEVQDLRPEWLIKNVLVRGQPAILGGPKKALKTSIIADGALSLASGTPFLGRFAVPERSIVAVVSGESGAWAIRDTALRIAKTKGVKLSDCSVFWGFDLPQVGIDADLLALAAALEKNTVSVLFLDPAYLCLIAGVRDVQMANMFQVGPLLMRLSRACQDVGTTLVLVHHSSKMAGMQRTTVGEPMELEDLAYAGFQEFARQWILVNRRVKFEPGSGKHQLWLNVGGSAGQSGLWGIDIDEGQLKDDFSGRRWYVEVMTAEAANRVDAIEKDKRKASIKDAKQEDYRKRVEAALASFPEGETARTIADAAGLQQTVVGPILTTLVNERYARTIQIAKPAGRGMRLYPGYQLAVPLTADQVEARVADEMATIRAAKRLRELDEEGSNGVGKPVP
jgi:hypothetical protein